MARWSFVVPLLLFTAATGVLLWVVLYGLHTSFGEVHAVMLAWFAALTGALHLWQERAMAGSPGGFVQRFMGALLLKMLLSVVVLWALLRRVPPDDTLPVGVVFATLYLVFLAFSTARLTALSRKLPKS